MVVKYPCLKCSKPVKNNQNAVLCIECKNWIHLSCSSLNLDFFNSSADWICKKCVFNVLPFHSLPEQNTNTNRITEPVNNPFHYSDCESVFRNLSLHRGLKICHLNVCSLMKNFEELQNLLIHHDIDIFTMCETRLDGNINDFTIEIDGYHIIRLDRNRHGGGIIVYIRNSVHYSVISEFVNDLELLCIKIDSTKQKPFYIVVWYRPPDSLMKCFEEFEKVLQFLDSKSNDYVIIGDLNCDVMKRLSSQTKRLMDLSSDYGLHQFVSKPTRVTSETCTLIDLFMSSNENFVQFCDVAPITLSDHYMVVAAVGKGKAPKSNHKYIKSRNLKNMDFNSFCKELYDESWSEVLNTNDVLTAYSKWYTIFRDKLDKHAPMKRRRVRKKTAPWMNNDIKILMRDRDRCKAKARVTKLESDWNKYKTSRNHVTAVIRKCKRKYVTESIMKNKGNPSEIWKLLRTLMANTKQSNVINCIKYGNDEFVNHKDIANVMNNSFVDVAKKLKLANVLTAGDAIQYVDKTTTVFSFLQITERDIMKSFDTIPKHKATGLDELPTRILKDCLPCIVKPLCHIINLSLTEGKIPDDWKSARVSPIFKGGDAKDPLNYRPISILPVLSKVLEKLVFTQIYKYFDDNDLFTDVQFGFRPNFSTFLALLTITENMRTSLDKGLAIGMVTLDLKKAFDMVPHDVIIDKLRIYGFDSQSLVWIRDYLHMRKQITVINGNFSEPQPVTCGVPQGSILGPLLFIIYLNDITKVVRHCTLSLYADDTCIYYACNDPDEMERKINEDLNNVANWLRCNELLLNNSKCEYMIVTSNRKRRHFANVQIRINNFPISRVLKCKYLGVVLNENMTWNDQIEKMKSKLTSCLYCLKRVRPYISQNTALSLYRCLIQPHFDYCSYIWRNAGKTQIKRLTVMQNRALRTVLMVDSMFSTSALYASLNVEPIELRWKKQALVLVFMLLHNLLPLFLCKRITLKKCPSHTLRNSKGIILLQNPKTNFVRNSSLYCGIQEFNSLPENIRILDNLKVFEAEVERAMKF